MNVLTPSRKTALLMGIFYLLLSASISYGAVTLHEPSNWNFTLPNLTPISFTEMLDKLETQNTEIRLYQEKINESAAKHENIEAKRMLFFFKYIDSDSLEGSAESDVMAAGEHAQAVKQQVLLNGIKAYYQLAQKVFSRFLSYQNWLQAKQQLLINREKFQSGEQTGIDVLQTEAELLHRYQEFLSLETQYQATALWFQEQLGEPFDITHPHYYLPTQQSSTAPNESEEKVFQVIPLQLLNTLPSPESLIPLALKQRPELKELRLKRLSLSKLNQTSSFKFDHNQRKILLSSLKQMDIKLNRLEQSIAISATVALEQHKLAQKTTDLANQQVELAKQALKQAQIANQSGLNSNKEVLDAQVALYQARTNTLNAVINGNISQIQVLYELGMLNKEALTNQSIHWP